VVTAVTITIAISDAIKQYSMAVAPDWSAAKVLSGITLTSPKPQLIRRDERLTAD
jgi:hypothetical protein